MDKSDAQAMSAPDILSRLTTTAQGLRAAEALSRRQVYGPNALPAQKGSALRILARQFQSSLVYVLMIASILSFAISDFSDGTIITAILLINALLGFWQEYHSERTIEQLSKLITQTTLVRRENKTVLVDVAELVPGDIVILKEGDIVPADVKLLSADGLQANESQLTGESVPVSKDIQGEVTGGAATLLFAGSMVEKGEGVGVVYATGGDTELGGIASLATSVTKVTQYERSLQAFSGLLIRIIVLTLALAFVAKIAITANGSSVFTLLLFVIALAIAVVPEALPVIATVTLSQGALKLAREHVIVKHLPALEDLGNITLLCTDKTGTLTENRMAVEKAVTEDEALFQTLAYATMEPVSGAGSSTQSSFDAALLAYVPDQIKCQSQRFRRLRELPFDPMDRRRRVVVADDQAHKQYLVVIGSAETLLAIARCPHADQYRAQIAADGEQGLRHLALAYAEVSYGEDVDILAYESHLTFLGFVALSDPLRPSSRHTIEMAQQLGVAIKILSGDSAEVAGYIGRQIGLLREGDRVYSGDDIAGMSSLELRHVAEEANVFARVTPKQKFAIIQALKENHVVGYQGDGINDAPALKLADVSIAVDSATDVAKDSADIILLKKDLEVIVSGIKYGRSVFANINKYIKYTMVGNFGNYFALAALFLLSSGLPLLPRQVLLISLITDIPLVTIATDRVRDEEIVRPERYDIHALMFISLVLGSLTALFELAFFATLKLRSSTFSETSLFLFLTLTQLVVIFSIRGKQHLWKAGKPSMPLSLAIGITFVVSLALPYTGPLATVFAFSALPAAELAMIAVMVLLYLAVLDVVKVWYYRLIERHPLTPARGEGAGSARETRDDNRERLVM